MTVFYPLLFYTFTLFSARSAGEKYLSISALLPGGSHAGSGWEVRRAFGCCVGRRGITTTPGICCRPTATTMRLTIATTTTGFVVCWWLARRRQGGNKKKSARCRAGKWSARPEPRRHLTLPPTPRRSRGKDAAPAVAGKRGASHVRKSRPVSRHGSADVSSTYHPAKPRCPQATKQFTPSCKPKPIPVAGSFSDGGEHQFAATLKPR